MLPGTRSSPERFGFASLVVLTLSPVCLQGIWRPLAQAFSIPGDSFAVTLAGLFVATAVLATDAIQPNRGLLAGGIGTAVALALGMFLATGTGAICLMVAVLSGVAALCAFGAPRLAQRLPVAMDGLSQRYLVRTALFVALGLVTVGLTARLSIFMGDASRTDLSLVPEIPFLVHHSCLTAYVEGARLVAAGAENIYDIARWPDLNGTVRTGVPTGPYAPFELDAFAYPPPFLLVPQALLSWLPDFASQRAIWFALNGVFTAVGLGIVAMWLRAGAGLAPLLLAPLVWTSAATLGTLQVGNVHLAIMVAAMLALVCFETRRFALGGALLAFAILSKISPGLLVIVLLLRGRFREVAWTAGFAAVYVVASVVAFGYQPLIDFVGYELPRLSSGEALAFLTGAETIPINLSPFGVPFKLAAFGMSIDDPWAIARRISQCYTLLLIGLAVVAGRRNHGQRSTVEIWLALLTLSSLRSPLAPGYVACALLWLLSIRAGELRGRAQVAAFAVIWLLIGAAPPFTGTALLVHSMIQQSLILGLAVYCLLRTSKAPSEVS